MSSSSHKKEESGENQALNKDEDKNDMDAGANDDDPDLVFPYPNSLNTHITIFTNKNEEQQRKLSFRRFKPNKNEYQTNV